MFPWSEGPGHGVWRFFASSEKSTHAHVPKSEGFRPKQTATQIIKVKTEGFLAYIRMFKAKLIFDRRSKVFRGAKTLSLLFEN